MLVTSTPSSERFVTLAHQVSLNPYYFIPVPALCYRPADKCYSH